MGDLTSLNVCNILRDHGYTNWDSLAKELQVPVDFRRRVKHKTSYTQDHLTALEEVLDHWIQNDKAYSWAVLLDAIERTGARHIAENLRKSQGIVGSSSVSSLRSSVIKPSATDQSSVQSRTLKSFLKVQEYLQPLLQISLNEFSSKLFTQDLIPDEIYDRLYDYTPASESERASFLVYAIYKRVSSLEAENKTSEAREIIRKFGEVVYGVDCVLRHIGREIMSYGSSQALLSNHDTIKSSVQSSLNTVAVKLMSLDLISDDEYDSITDPDSDHSKRFMADVFRSLREAIKQDYTIYTRLVQVIKEMGPPISTAAAKIIDEEFYQ